MRWVIMVGVEELKDINMKKRTIIRVPKVDVNLLHSEYIKNTKRGIDINAVFLHRMS